MRLALQLLDSQPGGFDWGFFREALFGTAFIVPALLVLMITLVSQTAGVLLGFLLAIGRTSPRKAASIPTSAYLYIFRGTPLLLQILIMYDGVGLLFGNPVWLYPISRNALVAGMVALALNEAAYMAEIIRSGLQAIDPGQMEAAKALGMTGWKAMRRIVVPQALRIIVPPTANEYINMSKNTSLLATIAVHELVYQAESFYSVNFRVFESLAVAAIWYLGITTILTQIQKQIEARFGERRDLEAAIRPGFFRRAFAGGELGQRP